MSLTTTLFLVWALSSVAVADGFETHVVGHDDDDAPKASRRRAERRTHAPERALEAIPGVVLSTSGGPLAPTRIDVRGLSGPRVDVRLGGLSLQDPAAGGVDAAAIPFFAVADATASSSTASSSLSNVFLETYTPPVPLHVVHVGAGTMQTLGVDARTTMVSESGADHVSAGASFARTEGDFSFVPTGPTGPLGPSTTRANNDQTRAAVVADARVHLLPGVVGTTTMIGTVHEGGIPGFSTAPTDGLRGRNDFFGAKAALSTNVAMPMGELTVTGSPSWRTARRQTTFRGRAPTALLSDEKSADTMFAYRLFDGAFVASATASVSATAVTPVNVTRQSQTFSAAFRAAPFGETLTVVGAASGAHISDVGLLGNAHLSTTLRIGPVGFTAAASRQSRPPTMDELYAPAGLVTANPALQPESLSEVEGAAHIYASRIIKMTTTAFFGRLDDAIVYVNRNAYEIAPVNTGGAFRSGCEIALAAMPHRYLTVDSRTRVLFSALDATGAPLPTTPPFFSRNTITLGPLSSAHINFVSRHRSAVTSNLFGTVRVAPFTLVDVMSVIPINPSVSIAATMSNVFDLRTAQDANLLPLAGRQFFVQLEVAR